MDYQELVRRTRERLEACRDDQVEAMGYLTESWRHYLDGLLSQQIVQDATARLTFARCWPGFRAHEAAIARAMRADADLSLWDAYQQVVLEGHVTDDGWALTPEGFVRKGR
jgi:hypothetical protein